MDPKEELLRYKTRIDQELAYYFEKKQSEYKKLSSFTTKFIQDLTEFTLRGGKRLRPALLYHSYKMFGGTADEEVEKLSIFIELIQSFLLIHDDIMDKAELRRGGKTIHKIYEGFASENNYPEIENFGNTMGILAGDLANQFSLEIIAKSDFEDSKKIKLLALIAKEISGVILGQTHDILLTYRSDYKFEDIMLVHYYKTGKYTYEIPMIAGGILAGVDNGLIVKIKQYAKNAGIAYQIHDDVLGMFGDDEVTGKPTLSDLKEGKHTLLTLIADEKANSEDKETLKKYIGKQDLTFEEAEEVKKIVIATGSLDYSKMKSKEYVKFAQDILSEVKGEIKDEKSWQFLYDIAEFAITRNS